MIQRGRKSSSANIVALPPPTRSRLTPPTILTVSERKIFIETAAQHPHLKPSDAMVLAAFAQASALQPERPHAYLLPFFESLGWLPLSAEDRATSTKTV